MYFVISIRAEFPPLYQFHQSSLPSGGLSTTSDCINTLESYNVEDNTWGPLFTMRENRHGCQACLLNNELYIIGGHNGRAYSATVERFTPGAETCDSVSSLPHPKAFAGSTVMGGRIYVIGGTGKTMFF